MAFCFGLWGLGWGLPSRERLDLFLNASQRNPEFYSELERARTDRYEKMGGNPSAYAGRLLQQGVIFDPPANPLHCFSSFILRTHDADEQATLVMISRLNPLKGRWYPGSYHYLGAYIYPLSAFLGAAHVAGVVKLVPGLTFYYEHPDAMAAIFRVLRFWSVLGLVFSACALFLFVRRFSTTAAALWSGLYFVLAPACLGFSKIGKPHIWAAGWTFLSMSFAFRYRESRRWRDLVIMGVLMGCALGTATTQSVFLPMLFWALWGPSPREFFKRALTLCAVIAAVFLVLNPFFFFHLQDYRDEIRFLSTWYSFKVRPAAIADFFWFILRPAMGTALFVGSIAGLIFALGEKKPAFPKGATLAFLVSVIVLAFQMQALSRDPLQVRPALAALGVLAAFAVQMTYRSRWGAALRWLCVVFMLWNATLYCRHFQSDKMPSDNATRASVWIKDNIPAGSVIELIYNIPTVDQFPPVRFLDYTFVRFGDTGSGTNGNYLVMNPRGLGMDERLMAEGYKLEARFEYSPLQMRGGDDVFTNANFPLRIYRKSTPEPSKNQSRPKGKSPA